MRGSGINNALLSSDPDTGLTSHSLGSTVPGRFVFTVSAAGQPTGCHGYVAVGDSYSSGVGTLDYYKGKPCFQSNYAWPYYLSKNFPAAPQVDHDSFFACSGDNSAQLLTGKTGEPVSQLTQLQNWVTSNGDPALVTLTDGGDDLHFGDLLATCVIAPLPICEGFLAYEELYLEFGGFKSTLQTTLQKFVSAAGNSSKLVLVGYPNLFPAPGFTNDLVATVMCPWTKLAAPSILSDFEFAQGLLNSAEQQVANADHVRFIELGDLFNGNESCTRHPLIQGVLSGLPNPFHPDQTGQSIMANFIGGQLGYLAGNGSGGQVQRHGSAKSPKAKPAKTGAKPEVKSGGKPGSARPAKDQPAKAPAGPAVRPRPSSDRASAAPSVNAGLADGQAGAPYLGFLWATGGTEPISWSVTSGSLPSGLSLDGSSGIISGTPTASGSLALHRHRDRLQQPGPDRERERVDHDRRGSGAGRPEQFAAGADGRAAVPGDSVGDRRHGALHLVGQLRLAAGRPQPRFLDRKPDGHADRQRGQPPSPSRRPTARRVPLPRRKASRSPSPRRRALWRPPPRSSPTAPRAALTLGR